MATPRNHQYDAKENQLSTAKKPESHQVTTYPLRLPPALREQLAAEAARNQRSLNGEIVFQLQNRKQGAVQ